MSPLLDLLDAVAYAMAEPLAGAILLNQLDDLFVDASYLLGGLRRTPPHAVPEEALRAAPRKRVAILVPAWREADVIARMLDHNLASIDYDRGLYDVFCGTYRNDPETQREVDAVARRFPSVHKVVVPHDGPTSKADCLNWVWRGVLDAEAQRGIRYDVLVLHDAEDVIHPLSLRLYATLIPRHEFVQTPVFSLDRGLGQWVAGTYLDEFAEHHLKELPVRAAIGGLVPSAGVGSAFDRAAFEEIALAHRHRPFDPESLTEDYEIGLEFRLAGKRVHFACPIVRRGAVAAAVPAARRAPAELIATREYFPSRLDASIRQRSRWILGIALQTWAKVGWPGSLALRYSLWRDRKALFTTSALALAYALLLWVSGRSFAAALGGPAFDAARVLGAGETLGALLAANTVGLGWRCAVKAWFVGRLYGPAQGLLAVPRIVVGNVIALAATARALRQWARHRVLGEPLRWAKTGHEFPSGALSAATPVPGDLSGPAGSM